MLISLSCYIFPIFAHFISTFTSSPFLHSTLYSARPGPFVSLLVHQIPGCRPYDQTILPPPFSPQKSEQERIAPREEKPFFQVGSDSQPTSSFYSRLLLLSPLFRFSSSSLFNPFSYLYFSAFSTLHPTQHSQHGRNNAIGTFVTYILLYPCGSRSLSLSLEHNIIRTRHIERKHPYTTSTSTNRISTISNRRIILQLSRPRPCQRRRNRIQLLKDRYRKVRGRCNQRRECRRRI